MRWAKREPQRHQRQPAALVAGPLGPAGPGSSHGAAFTYYASDTEVCFAIKLYSALVWCLSSSLCCGSVPICSHARWRHAAGGWRGPRGLTTFGGSVAYSPDPGQVDFATVASVSSAGRSGLLAFGTLWPVVISTGSLQLQLEMKAYIDSSSTRDCSLGGHMYAEGSRCYSRTPNLVVDVACSGAGCSHRLLDLFGGRQQLARRMNEPSSRALLMNIDANGA